MRGKNVPGTKLIIALLLAAGLVHAWMLRWVCDDAFISYRYASNLCDGLGLVYNAGERVEGYSNFLWTMLIALGNALGLESVALAQGLGLACYAGSLALCVLAAEGRVPIAALALAGNYHVKVYATGGLETALFSLLALALVLQATRARAPRDLVLAGLLATLAALTRPDGALLYASAGLLVLLAPDGIPRVKALAALALPGLVLFVPYLLWRWSYYGELVPNTFYAKAAHDPYPSQGLVYVREYLLCHYVLIPALLLAVWLAVRRVRAALAIVVFVVPYVLFVVWVGGDFMFGRFLVPVTATLLLAFDLVRSRIWLALFVTAGAWLCNYPGAFKEGVKYCGISEEPRFYTTELVTRLRGLGRELRQLTAGLDVRALITGATAMVAYEARFPVVIEGATGLTDRHIARRPVGARGMVGHEKGISPFDPYVLERGVQLSFIGGKAGDATDAARMVQLGAQPVLLVRYDAALLRELARRGPGYVQFVPCEQVIDRYLAEAAAKGRDELKRDYEGFRRFYFAWNADPERERRFAALVR